MFPLQFVNYVQLVFLFGIGGKRRLVIWVLLTILVSVTCKNLTSIAKTPKPVKSGPFRSIVVSTGPCAKPTRPYVQNQPTVLQAELYNTTKRSNLIRGNFTVLRESKNFKMSYKGYYYENDKWQLRYYFNNIACNGVIIKAVYAIVGIKFDEKTCAVPKGSYKFENVDWDIIEHTLWSKKRDYGRLKWVTESYTRTGVILCWEIENIVIPA